MQLALEPATPRPFPVDSRFGPFKLLIRQPTYQEQLEDEGRSLYIFSEAEKAPAYRERVLARLDIVTGWEDVTEKDRTGRDTPSTYTKGKLVALLARDKGLAATVAKLIATAFEETPLPPGESDAPPPATSPGDPSEAQPICSSSPRTRSESA